jgi:signal transduction histidine kinase
VSPEFHHILLIEYSTTYAKIIRDIFAESQDPVYTVSCTGSVAEGVKALSETVVDAVLLDPSLPDGEGLDSFRRVREATQDAPIIVLTGLKSEAVANTMLKEGAQDYLIKPDITRSALLRCVRYGIERRRAEMALAQSRKMESIGQLAAGIAHEINTPIQFIGDSIAFIRDSFEELNGVRRDCLALCAALEQSGDQGGRDEALRRLREGMAWEELESEVCEALDRTQEGLRRVSEVVSAMREFSHPSGREKERADLNHAIQNTVTIANSQYRHVAELVAELGDIPPVRCHLGEINQVLLNLIVNAAQAMEDSANGGERGAITVRSRLAGDSVRVEVCDTGPGIRDEIRRRVFDPFFTTKPVGRGTGQGLALAHASIVKKHGGRLDFESRVGEGTTFWFTLPIDSDAEEES